MGNAIIALQILLRLVTGHHRLINNPLLCEKTSENPSLTIILCYRKLYLEYMEPFSRKENYQCTLYVDLHDAWVFVRRST